MIAQQDAGDRAVPLIVFIAAMAGGFVAVVLAVAANYAPPTFSRRAQQRASSPLLGDRLRFALTLLPRR